VQSLHLAQLCRLQFLHHAVYRRELRGMRSKKFAQMIYDGIARGIGVHADGPQPGSLFHRRPQLLRNPCEAAAREWNARESVREQPDSFVAQSSQRVAVKAVTRGKPKMRGFRP